MNTTIEKVTAFITRGEGAARELLVFAHPSAGIQVPAGTVDPGERIEAAVLRETLEESGVAAVTIRAYLGAQTSELRSGTGILTSTTPIFAHPAPDAPSAVLVPQRGWPIAVEGADEHGWSPVAYEDYDINVDPPRLLLRNAGWIPTGCIGTCFVRHFFHLGLTAPTPERWEHLAEGRLRFSFFWTPLIPRPRLVTGQGVWYSTGQDVWLDAVYGQLTAQP